MVKGRGLIILAIKARRLCEDLLPLTGQHAKHRRRAFVVAELESGMTIERICQACGKIFYVYPSRLKKGTGKYCSIKCAVKGQYKKRIKRTCQNCGKVFYILPSDAQKKGSGKYCSNECKHRAHRNRVELACQLCGKGFSAKPSGNRKYCSNKCRGLARRARIKLVCEFCDTSFESEIGTIRKYCSRECYQAALLQRQESIICENCREKFIVPPSRFKRGTVRFCSIECKNITFRGEQHPSWTGGSFEPYDERFNDEFKKAIRERDRNTCQICGELGYPIHHIDYDKQNTTMENCITLCIACHSRTNYKREYWQATLNDLMQQRMITCQV